MTTVALAEASRPLPATTTVARSLPVLPLVGVLRPLAVEPALCLDEPAGLATTLPAERASPTFVGDALEAPGVWAPAFARPTENCVLRELPPDSLCSATRAAD